jgi:hypothetical protein
MAYLHGREYMDEADQNKMKRCVLHRDLKVVVYNLMCDSSLKRYL